MSTELPAGTRPGARRAPEWLAIALQLAVGVFPYGASGLMAPPVGLVILAVIWTGCVVALWRWRPENPWLTLLVPVGAVVAWFAVLTFGDAVLGWTA